MNTTETYDLNAWDQHLKETGLDHNEVALQSFLQDYFMRLTEEATSREDDATPCPTVSQRQRLRHVELWMRANNMKIANF